MLDEEARERLAPALAARRLVDFSGPHGWEHSATNLGRVEPLGSAPADGVSALRRRVLPLVELRADFDVCARRAARCRSRRRRRRLGPLDEAAHQLATAENVAVFHGWTRRHRRHRRGLAARADAARRDPSGYPRSVAGAVELLLQSGIAGPYGLALGSEQYRS